MSDGEKWNACQEKQSNGFTFREAGGHPPIYNTPQEAGYTYCPTCGKLIHATSYEGDDE